MKGVRVIIKSRYSPIPWELELPLFQCSTKDIATYIKYVQDTIDEVVKIIREMEKEKLKKET